MLPKPRVQKSTNALASSATAPKKSSAGSRTSQKAKAAPPKNQQEVIVIDPEKAKKLLKNLKRPPPVLLSDYDRSIVKSYAKPERRIRKQVPQLGEQKNQSCPPLKVFSNTDVGWSIVEAEQYDPEIVALYGEAAAAQGMTIADYMAQLKVFSEDEIRHPSYLY